MTEPMMVRIDPGIKKKLSQLARSEGKSSSQIVRDLIAEYVQDRDIGGYIDDLWGRIGQKFRRKGLQPSDVRQVITEVRRSKTSTSLSTPMYLFLRFLEGTRAGLSSCGKIGRYAFASRKPFWMNTLKCCKEWGSKIIES